MKVDPFGDFTEHKIGFDIDAKELFERLKNSTHMEKQDYTTLYSEDFLDKGVEIYRLCFEKDIGGYLNIYLHLRFNFGKIDTIYYLVPFGDGKTALSDFNTALQEIKPD